MPAFASCERGYCCCVCGWAPGVNSIMTGAQVWANPGGLSSAHSEGKATLNSGGLLQGPWAQNSLHSSFLGVVIANMKDPGSSCPEFSLRLVCPDGSKVIWAPNFESTSWPKRGMGHSGR